MELKKFLVTEERTQAGREKGWLIVIMEQNVILMGKLSYTKG
jgi:hypothetical protein